MIAVDADPRPTILVVDDDPDVRDAIAESLEEAGYAVARCQNGSQALHLLIEEGFPASLIILDLMMPGMDGWEFRELQRATPKIAHIPVVALSAHADLSRIDAEARLRKPVSFETLTSTVRRTLPRGSRVSL